MSTNPKAHPKRPSQTGRIRFVSRFIVSRFMENKFARKLHGPFSGLVPLPSESSSSSADSSKVFKSSTTFGRIVVPGNFFFSNVVFEFPNLFPINFAESRWKVPSLLSSVDLETSRTPISSGLRASAKKQMRYCN